jgi:hypothetical protein
MTDETREESTSLTYHTHEEMDDDDADDDMDDDVSDDGEVYDEEDLSSTAANHSTSRPRSRRSGALAARASLAGRHQSSSASTLGGVGIGIGSGGSQSLNFPSGVQIPPSDRHRGTGRKKIDIKPIPYKLKRQITFSKRKTGLLKKVKELTTLTQTEALVILVSETGNPHSYATKKFHDMIRNSDTKTLNTFLDTEEKRSKGGKH